MSEQEQDREEDWKEDAAVEAGCCLLELFAVASVVALLLVPIGFLLI